jgi:hypothetical protein
MAKLSIILLSYALLLACSYDAGRLLRPGGESAAADASRSDTPSDILGGDTGRADTHDAGAADSRDADIRGNDNGVRDTGKSGSEDGGADVVSGVLASADAEATFASGRAQGAMSGYGYVSLGVVDSVTSPTCNGVQIGGLAPSMPPVTFNSTCPPSGITWGSATGLCVSGSIPGWSSRLSYMDYMIDWGIMVGAATREPVQAMGVSYRTVTLTVSGGDESPLFAVVHLADDANHLTYCASMRSGEAIKLSAFNTECLFDSGQRLADSDVQKIDKLGIQVPSSESAITLSDFCLIKIEFAK